MVGFGATLPASVEDLTMVVREEEEAEEEEKGGEEGSTEDLGVFSSSSLWKGPLMPYL